MPLSSMCYPTEFGRSRSNERNEGNTYEKSDPARAPFKVTQGRRKRDTDRSAACDFLLTSTMGLSRTVSEINGDFSRILSHSSCI